jgi:hypothetical protein
LIRRPPSIRRALTGAVLAGAALAVSCTAGCTAGSDPVDAPPPAPPPAACLLDTAALAATTGLTWTPDATTASDTRCVYDPTTTGVPAEGPAFVSVDVAPVQGPDTGAALDPAAALDTVAEVCTDGSRAPVTAGQGGFVCRFQGGSVFAALVRGDRMVTLAASAVPPGTTAAQLVIAFDQQLTALGR